MGPSCRDREWSRSDLSIALSISQSGRIYRLEFCSTLIRNLSSVLFAIGMAMPIRSLVRHCAGLRGLCPRLHLRHVKQVQLFLDLLPCVIVHGPS